MDATGSQPLTIVALVRSPQTRQTVAEILAGVAATARISVGVLTAAEATLLATRRAHLLIIDIDLDHPGELAALEGLVPSLPAGAAIIVTTGTPTVEGMRRLMRLGILDVVPQPIVAKELLQTVRAALDGVPTRSAAQPPPRGFALSFLRACGGVGATTLAVQSSLALAARNKAKPSVCLLDFDLQFGSTALHLDLPQKTSMLDLLAAGERLDGSMLRGAVARHRSGLDLLPAPVLVQPLDTITPEASIRLVEAARHEYDHVLIDLPPVWTGWSRAVLAASDGIALVLDLTVPAVRHARRQIETLADEHLDHIPLTIIANRVATGLFARGIGVKEAEKALGRRFDLAVPFDPKIPEAVNVGRPLAEIGGGRRTVNAIANLLSHALARAGAPPLALASHPAS